MRDYPATKTVHWASGPVYTCEKHAVQLNRVAQALGYHIGITEAPEGSECVNCKNESEKEP